jgi:hypothetical protein
MFGPARFALLCSVVVKARDSALYLLTGQNQWL